jgi:hypothetical protein
MIFILQLSILQRYKRRVIRLSSTLQEARVSDRYQKCLMILKEQRPADAIVEFMSVLKVWHILWYCDPVLP